MPGPRILHGYDVIIEGARIKQILPSRKQEKGKFAGRVINGTGKFLIPGLFDMHVHLESKSFFPLFLMNGVTAIREVGSTRKDIFQLRDKVNAGKITGPRMFIAGPILEGYPPFWQGFRIVRTKKEGKQAVKELKEKRADFIKVYQTLKLGVYREIVHEAKKQKLKVIGHLPKSIDPIVALNLGQKELEHMDDIRQHVGEVRMKDISKKGYEGWKKFTGLKIKQARLKNLGQVLQKNKAFICPTLVVDERMAQLSNYEKLKKLKEARLLPRHYREIDWKPSHPKSLENIRGLPPLWFQNFKVLHENSKQIIPFLAKHSILLAGSDTPNPFVVPGFSLIEELELFVKTGLQPYQAIEAATYNPSLFLDISNELGTIKEGKIANLVLLEKNPIQSISFLRTIQGTFLNGNYYPRLVIKNKTTSFT